MVRSYIKEREEVKAYYPYAKTVYQGEKYMTIQFMLWWFDLFHRTSCQSPSSSGSKK